MVLLSVRGVIFYFVILLWVFLVFFCCVLFNWFFVCFVDCYLLLCIEIKVNWKFLNLVLKYLRCSVVKFFVCLVVLDIFMYEV